jgi:hypothetical protein
MARFERHFSWREAQRTLPWINLMFAKIHRVITLIRRDSYGIQSGIGGEEGDRLTHPSIPAKGAQEPTGALGTAERAILALNGEEKQQLLRELAQAIVDRGIIIQDVERGLIDFPSWRKGEEVLLCYETADGDRIGFWHALDAGYAGRREIADIDEFCGSV